MLFDSRHQTLRIALCFIGVVGCVTSSSEQIEHGGETQQDSRALRIEFISSPNALDVPIYRVDVTRGRLVPTAARFQTDQYERIPSYGHGIHSRTNTVYHWVQTSIGPDPEFIIIEGPLMFDDNSDLIDPLYTATVRTTCPEMSIEDHRLVPAGQLQGGNQVFLFSEPPDFIGDDPMSHAFGEYNTPYLAIGLPISDSTYMDHLRWVSSSCLGHPSPWVQTSSLLVNVDELGPRSEFRDKLVELLKLPEGSENLLDSKLEQMRHSGEYCRDILRDVRPEITTYLHRHTGSETVDVPTVAVFLCAEPSGDANRPFVYSMRPTFILASRLSGFQFMDMLVINVSPQRDGKGAPSIAFGTFSEQDDTRLKTFDKRPAFLGAGGYLSSSAFLISPGIENATWVMLTAQADTDLSAIFFASGHFYVRSGSGRKTTRQGWDSNAHIRGQIRQK